MARAAKDVHTCKGVYVHRQRVAESNPAIQSAQSADHLVASCSRESRRMEGEMRPTPWLARRHAKEKSLIKNGGALRLGFRWGKKTTEIGLTTSQFLRPHV